MPSFIIYLSLAGLCSADPPRIQPDPSPSLPQFDEEAFDRDFQARVRRRIALMESNIKLFEMPLTEFPEFYTPAQLSRLREKVEQERIKVSKWKEFQKELERYEQQHKLKPGLYTDVEALARLEKWHWELFPRPIAPQPREKR